MNSHHILLAVAAILACSSATSVAIDQTKLLKIQTPNQVEPNDAVLKSKNNRLLRVHDVKTDDEERGKGDSAVRKAVAHADDFVLVDRAAAHMDDFVMVNRAAPNGMVMVGKAKPFGDFSIHAIGEMISNSQFKLEMFEKWDQFSLEVVKKNIGAKMLKDRSVAAMFEEYVRHKELRKL
ncbi:RxLR effector protein [Phytophthora megakarya]|uniref:RxLR effector protein n=1 Tax=Phytophthora megakarya TaxID=4795 RepID=A0A225VBA6_9STRA|nr:RxLR effector protein [Phytophthora megakarya]